MVTLKELIQQRRKKEKKRRKVLTKEEREEQIIDWCDFYRKNWDIYAEKSLGIPLKPFQSLAIHLAGISQVFYFMCSRGMSKSFLSALISFIICLLYPNSEIVLTATTVASAKKMVKNKMQKELCGIFSPKLKYLYENDFIHFTLNEEEIRVDFKMNGSWILVLPEKDSARGERATGVVFEEYRQSKPDIVKRVFLPMRHARRASYLLKPEYEHDKTLVENARIIYLTSTGYKFESFWATWKSVVEKMFNKNSKTIYTAFAGDVFTSIYYNLFSEEDFEVVKTDDSVSEMEIEMEYYNIPQGETTGSFYAMKQFKDNSVIENGFIPPTYLEYAERYNGENGMSYLRERKEGEIRIIYVDFAFTDTVLQSQENDNSVIGCASAYPNENRTRLLRNYEYMETYSGGDKEGTLKRIRELFYFYQADYFIYDNLNGGQDRFVDLSKPYFHEELGITMNGFGICKDLYLTDGFCEWNKVQNIADGVIDKNALPVSIPVVGNSERNSAFHITMKNSLINHTSRFLMDEMELKKKMADNEDFMFMDSTSKARRLIGHIQMDLMVNEAIKLEQKINRGFIKLEEPRVGTKDRIVATEYANYFFHIQELKMMRENQEEELDLEEIQLVY